MTPNKKPSLAWGGFVDGQLDAGFRLANRPEWMPLCAVFTTRNMARQFFMDVRRVEIREVAPSKKR